MAKMIARVFRANESEVGSLVELSNGQTRVAGRVAQASENEFLVDWEDGYRSVENKSDYELVIEERTAGAALLLAPLVRKVVTDPRVQKKVKEVAGPIVEPLVQKGKELAGEAVATGVDMMQDGIESLRRKRGEGQATGSVTAAENSEGRPPILKKCPGGCDTTIWAYAENCGKCRSMSTQAPATFKNENSSEIRNEYDPRVLTGSVTAAENPAQPAGWAVPPVDAEAYPNGELIQEQFDKRRDTAEWTDAQNRAPMDNENPAQPAGFAVPEASGQPIPGQGADGLAVAANVYANDLTGEDGLVELENEDFRMIGKVIAAKEDEFLVQWQDSTRTIEDKSNYQLILSNEKNAPDPSSNKYPSSIRSPFEREFPPGFVRCDSDSCSDGIETIIKDGEKIKSKCLNCSGLGMIRIKSHF